MIHFTPDELKGFMLHCGISVEESQKKLDKFMRWVGKKRNLNAPPVFTPPSTDPKRDPSIKWKGKTPDELKAIEQALSGTIEP